MSQFTGAFPAPSWTPPPREPFVPLRPLTLGQILAGAFRALRHNPAVTLAPAIVVSLLAAFIALGCSLLVLRPALERLGSSTGAGELYAWLAAFGAGLVGWIVGQAAVLAAGSVQQGVSALDVAHAVLGRRLLPAGLRRRSRGLVGRLLGWTLIVFLVVVAGGLAGTFLLGTAALVDPLAAVLLGGVLYPGGAVLAAWFGTRFAFVPSVLVVERARLVPAVRRARQLTRGAFWRVFGIRILSWGMIWIATGIVGVPVQLLAGWFASILAGNGDTSDSLTIDTIAGAVTAIIGAIIAAIGLVITTATDALLYLDQRMRLEGLDLELSRFMEHRRPGSHHDPHELDPYRSPASAPPAPSTRAPDPQERAWG